MKRIAVAGFLVFIFTSFTSLNAQQEKSNNNEKLYEIGNSYTSQNDYWIRSYGGESSEMAYSMEPTNDGGYIVAGYTYSFGAGDGDIWILKFSSEGDIEWQKTYGGSRDDRAYSVLQTNDGGFIVAGSTFSYRAGECDIWILKLSSEGDIEWQKTYGGTEVEAYWYCDIQQTSDNGFIVAGSTWSFGAGYSDIWILKLSSEGDIEWQKTYGGSDFEDAWVIQQINDGSYIVLGYNRSLPAKDGDFWILKLFPNGDIEWQKLYGEVEGEDPQSLLQTNDGGYIVAGDTCSFGAGSESFGTYGWILKLLSNGDIEWQKIYSGSESISIKAIKKTVDGGYICAGSFGKYALAEHNSYILVMKLFPDGNIEWQRAYGGSRPDFARSVYQTNDGGYIVSGFFGGRPISGENSDIPILKLPPDGDVPICPIMRTSDASALDTFISPSDTSVIPMETNVIPQSTDIQPQDSNAVLNILCPGFWNLILSCTTGGTTNPAPGTYYYDNEIEVAITAMPKNDYEFSGWTGDVASGHENDNPITITIDSNKSLTANFSAKGEEKKGLCFIATSAYGSPLHPHVNILREFRDKYLIPSKIGHLLVDFYYKYSPYIARLISKNKVLRAAVRISLLPLVAFSYSMVNFGPIITAVKLFFIFAVPIFIISFWRKKIIRKSSK